MLTVEQCRQYIPNRQLTDEQVEELRDSLYLVVGEILDQLYENDHETSC